MEQASLKNSHPENDQLFNPIMVHAIHEIRTPVQTIVGIADLLFETTLSKEQREYVRRLKTGSEILLSISNDILDYSRIQYNGFSIEKVPFNAKSLVESTVHFISLEAFSKSLEIEFDIDYSLPDLILGDPTRTRQILLNLLKNAVKFTSKGYIYVELERMEKESGMFLLFKVTDSGMGIDENKSGNIFKDFYQGGDASFSRHYGGSGLGLSICRLLAERIGGEIGFFQGKFGGTTFWFTIPFEGASEENNSRKELPFPDDTKILIAAKNALVANSLSKKLEFLGLKNATRAENPNEAFLAMQYASRLGKPFLFAFIEDEMDNVERLAKKIQGSPILAATNVYLIEKDGLKKQFKTKKDGLFSDILQKPVTLENLASILEDASPRKKAMAFIKKQEQVENKRQQAELLKEQERECARGIKILVAEDHSVNRRILTEFLKHFGAEVVECENGEEVLETHNAHPGLQIIFMDIKMPILGGLETAVELRKKQYTGVIIACSGGIVKEDVPAYKKAGINDILHKPFQKESVKQMLTKWKDISLMNSEQQKILIETNTVKNDELWDRADFENTINGDWNWGLHIAVDYINQTKHLIEKARKAVLDTDFTSLDTIVHTIKGSSAAISANLLSKIAGSLNQAIKNKDIEDAEQSLSYFEKMFEIFILAVGKTQEKVTGGGIDK